MTHRLLADMLASSEEKALDLIGDILRSAIDIVIIELDRNGIIRLCSEGVLHLYGYPAEELVGADWAILHPAVEGPGDSKQALPHQQLLAAAEEGEWEGLVSQASKGGKPFTASMRIRSRKDKSGQIVGFLLLAREVLAQSRQVEEQPLSRRRDLLAIQKQFQELLEFAPDGMVIVNDRGEIILANRQAEQLFGYTRQEMASKPVELLVPERYGTVHPRHRQGYTSEPRVRPMGANLDLYGLHKDGREFPVEISLSPLETEDQLLVIAAIRDVTERRRIEQVLREKNIELAQVNQAKDRFLASMSHELRTPLNAIIGFTGTLLMKLPGPLTADQERQLQTVHTSARHLLSLINDLLDLAKIESGKFEVYPEPVVCQAVIEEVGATLRPLAEAKGLRFELRLPQEEIVVQTDRRALSQIILNLVNNAIKFTEQGGIRLELEQRQENGYRLAAIHIVDSGIGIRLEDQARLFRAFEQLNKENRVNREGTGLGLYLSQKLAELLKAEITFHSTEGQGSTFSLILKEKWT